MPVYKDLNLRFVQPVLRKFGGRYLKNTRDETHKYFTEVGVDIRPFFYPINKHNHLSTIKNDDSCSEILNKEIIMIPSSPEITIEQQQKVVQTIFDFVIIGFCIFIVLKAYEKAQQKIKKEENPEESKGPTQEQLLTEIRDLLKNK